MALIKVLTLQIQTVQMTVFIDHQFNSLHDCLYRFFAYSPFFNWPPLTTVLAESVPWDTAVSVTEVSVVSEAMEDWVDTVDLVMVV